MPSSFWVASTKPEAALARGQGFQPWQEGGWDLAPRDRGPEAGMYCWKRHYYAPTRFCQAVRYFSFESALASMTWTLSSIFFVGKISVFFAIAGSDFSRTAFAPSTGQM